MGGAEGDGLVALEHHLLVVGRVGRSEIAEDEAAFGSVLASQAHSFDVGGNDFVVIVAAATEAGFDEVFQVLLGHVDELGEGADDDHVGGPVVAGGAGQGVDGQAEGPGVGHGEVVGVINNNPAVAHFFGVGFVGFLVESDQHVHLVAGAQYGLGTDSGLGPSGAAENLGREGGVGEGVVADLSGSLGQTFRRGNDALAAFTGEPDDEVVHLHLKVPPNRQ